LPFAPFLPCSCFPSFVSCDPCRIQATLDMLVEPTLHVTRWDRFQYPARGESAYPWLAETVAQQMKLGVRHRQDRRLLHWIHSVTSLKNTFIVCQNKPSLSSLSRTTCTSQTMNILFSWIW
jgi:hypothetical protein